MSATTLIAALAFGCGHDGSGPASPSPPSLPASLVFAAAPMDLSVITGITPLGNLNPPGHTLPTNHIYFGRPASGIPVSAPGSGVVQVVTRGTDDALLVAAAPGTSYNIGHVILDASIVAGVTLTAGQRIGVTGLSNALDLGVSNEAVTLFFVRPERYISGTIHADSPLKYFQEPIRSALYAKVTRSGPDKDGKIDFDLPGRLSGNWFLQGLPAADTENVVNGPKHLAFVRDVTDPSLVRISIGGSVSLAGAFYVADGTPDPAAVTPATGLVSYRLFTDPLRIGSGVGLLIVQMLADDAIRIETFAGSATTASFTPAALVYVR